MTRTRVGMVLFGLAVLPALLAAQQKPDFSGRWVQVEPAEGAGTEGRVIHDLKANTLTLDHDSEGHGHRLMYQLDGIESRSTLPSHGSEIVILSKAMWSGNQISITSVATYPDGRRLETKQLWSIDTGGQLIIELTETINGKTRTIRTVGKKG
jgi:hypothetical protein